MKFYDKHYRDITASFIKCGLTKDNFQFIKKRGRIITQHRSTKTSFSYILKKETGLKALMDQKEDASFYEIKDHDKPVIRVQSWEDVLLNLETWLNKISSSSR